ncbi:MAG: hypothetical protein HN622_01155 [Candidatus Marinimicrobia bacterium]|jgi:uncharacterized membrane protein YgcG|nr:hypothetical protein [Candidatus Neomarinimicrobiota bacterium]
MRNKTIFIGLGLIFTLSLQGCYTQLAMFYPDPEEDSLESYSRAGIRPSVDMYAQDGAGTPIGMAYSTMQNRFSPFHGYNNYNSPYSFYNDPYSGYGGYNSYGYGYNNYGYSYNIGGYSMFIPVADKKDIRQFTKDRNRTNTTNLQVNRTSNTNQSARSSSSRNSGSSGSYSSGSNSSSSGSSRSSGSSGGGRRATRRN